MEKAAPKEARPLLAALLFWVPLALLGTLFYSELMERYFRLPARLGAESRDLFIYQRVGEAIVAGDVPYRDFFIEYPPGSLPFFVPPAIMTESRAAYAAFFASEMALVLVAALVLTALAARALGRLWLAPAAIFAVGALLLNPVAVTRYDAVVALSLAAAVALAAGAAVGQVRPAWAVVAAGASLGVGAAAKLVPVLAAPPLALLARRLRSWWGVTLGVAAFSGVVALFFLPAYLMGREGFRESFSYHADRGLQVESLASSVLMKLGYLHGVSFEYGAFEVWGRGVEFWTSMSLPVTGALLILTAAVALREHLRGRFGAGQVPRFAAAFLLAFILGSKVLSPQYMIWLLPLIPLSAPGLWGLGASGLFLAACWMTTRIFPKHYDQLLTFQQPATDLLLERNLLLVVLWGLMLALPSGEKSEGKHNGPEGSPAP